MRTVKSCVFCSKSLPAVKITKEHVLRRWLKHSLDLPNSAYKKEGWHADSAGAKVEHFRRVPNSPFERVVNDVCKTCNEGWLEGRIEKPVGELLVHLALGCRAAIDRRSAILLAIWAAKTALVIALLERGKRVIPSAHYELMRSTLMVPPDTSIWLGTSSTDEFVVDRHLRFGNGRLMGHQTTIAMRRTTFLISGFSENVQDADQVRSELIALEGTALARLWPNPQAFAWPLPTTLPVNAVEHLGGAVLRGIERVTSR